MSAQQVLRRETTLPTITLSISGSTRSGVRAIVTAGTRSSSSESARETASQ